MRIPQECTLLELMQRLSASPLSEQAVMAMAVELVNSGRVRLRGKFAGAKITHYPSLGAFLAWVRSRPFRPLPAPLAP